MVSWDHLASESYTSTSRKLINKVVTYHERLPLLKSHDPLNRWPTGGLLTNSKNCLLFHKAYDHQNWQDGKDFGEETLPTNSYASLITWPYEVMWQIKNVSPSLQDRGPPNITGLWLTVTGSHPVNHKTIWSHDYVRSRDNLQTLVFSLFSWLFSLFLWS